MAAALWLITVTLRCPSGPDVNHSKRHLTGTEPNNSKPHLAGTNPNHSKPTSTILKDTHFVNTTHSRFISPLTLFRRPPSAVLKTLVCLFLEQDHAKAVSTLQKLNVPYLCTVPLVFQSFEEWQASELGLHPIQVALQVLVSLLYALTERKLPP